MFGRDKLGARDTRISCAGIRAGIEPGQKVKFSGIIWLVRSKLAAKKGSAAPASNALHGQHAFAENRSGLGSKEATEGPQSTQTPNTRARSAREGRRRGWRRRRFRRGVERRADCGRGHSMDYTRDGGRVDHRRAGARRGPRGGRARRRTRHQGRGGERPRPRVRRRVAPSPGHRRMSGRRRKRVCGDGRALARAPGGLPTAAPKTRRRRRTRAG